MRAPASWVVVCLASAAVLSSPALAAEPLVVARPSHSVIVNPAEVGFGVLSFEYEARLSDRWSLAVGPVGLRSTFGDTQVTGGAVGVDIKLFLLGSALEGLWITPELGAGYAVLTQAGASRGTFAFSLGGQVGYTWIFWDHLVVSPSGGVSVGNNGDQIGPRPILRLGLGYAW